MQFDAGISGSTSRSESSIREIEQAHRIVAQHDPQVPSGGCSRTEVQGSGTTQRRLGKAGAVRDQLAQPVGHGTNLRSDNLAFGGTGPERDQHTVKTASFLRVPP
jgi:hypothetical protein